jgi:hypothetical protein
MKKKILMLFVSILAVAMLAVPVMAEPTKGQKVEITMTQVATSPPTPIDDDVFTGPVTHSHVNGYYDVTIEIKDGATVVSTLVGDAVLNRKLVRVPQKGSILGRWIFTDYYEITIDTVDGESVDGGFEGNGKTILDGVNPAGMGISWELGRANALFHGTEDFEGQTLNFKSAWTTYVGPGPIVWDGYLLKP